MLRFLQAYLHWAARHTPVGLVVVYTLSNLHSLATCVTLQTSSSSPFPRSVSWLASVVVSLNTLQHRRCHISHDNRNKRPSRKVAYTIRPNFCKTILPSSSGVFTPRSTYTIVGRNPGTWVSSNLPGRIYSSLFSIAFAKALRFS